MNRTFLISAILFSIISPQLGFAQNLTGIWRGSFYNPTEIAMGGAKYRYEVQIDNHGREVKGVTYSYQTTRFYGKASLVGIWSPSSKNFTLKEDRMVDLKIVGGGDGCLMTCYLTYTKADGKEYLEGTYTSYNMNDNNASCGGGKVILERVQDTDFELEDFLVKKGKTNKPQVKPGQESFVVKKPTAPKPTTPQATKPPVKKIPPPATVKKPPVTKPPVTKTEPEKKPDIVVKPDLEPEVKTVPAPIKPKPLPPAPAILKTRTNELFKTITTTERTIEISFYDNGEIDGDTISVYNNNRLVTRNRGLSTKPIIITLELDKSEPLQEVIMVAENLGRIPPNTALMIIKAGSKQYTVSLTSTEQKNAMVRFKYEGD